MNVHKPICYSSMASCMVCCMASCMYYNSMASCMVTKKTTKAVTVIRILEASL